MTIKAFQLTQTENISIHTHAASLDELTRDLPQGYYTTFSTLAQAGKVLGLRSHLQRLYIPAQETGLHPAVDESTLRARVANLVKENLPSESRVRLILTKDTGVVYVGIQPFKPHPEIIYTHGVRTVTSVITRHDPQIKDTGFITESVEQRKLLSKDIFEILLTKNGKILEGMTSNFYGVKGRTIITARQGILAGVTRKAVLEIARGQGMSIEYRAPHVDEKFNEAFLTSSSRGVVPIVSIDNKPVGQGSVGKWAKILSQAYQAYVEERSERIVE